MFDQYGDVSIAVWSAGRSLVLKKSSAVPSQPQMLMIGSGPIKNEQVDDIDVCLGLRFELSPRRPSELVADKKENVIVRRGLGERSGLVDVVFIGPTFGPELCITNVYDPDRGWALVEQRAVLSKDKVVDEAVALDRQRVSARYEMGGWRQSNGVWAPSQIDKHVTMRPGAQSEVTGHNIIYFESMEFNPSISDGDFDLPIADMPRGSAVADSTLGVSYKLGESVMYMDGRLHQLTAPVQEIITSATLPEVMRGAVAMVRPEAATLASVSSRTNWWKWGGIGFFAAGAVALAAVLWMRRRAAA